MAKKLNSRVGFPKNPRNIYEIYHNSSFEYFNLNFTKTSEIININTISSCFKIKLKLKFTYILTSQL